MAKKQAKKTKRDYKKEYADYHGKPQQIKERNARNAARALLVKEGRVKKGDGKDVDHKNHKPTDNSRKNLRVMSASKNRADNAHKTTKKPKSAPSKAPRKKS